MTYMRVVREPSLEIIIQCGESIRIYQTIFIWVKQADLVVMHGTREKMAPKGNLLLMRWEV